MKVLRSGPRGAEKSGVLDAGGNLRDLSGVIGDLSGAVLTRAGDRRHPDVAGLPPDEMADPQELGMWLRVNGQSLQDGSTRTIVYGGAFSGVLLQPVLHPGDIIWTGTPPAVGIAGPGRQRQVCVQDRAPSSDAYLYPAKSMACAGALTRGGFKVQSQRFG